MKKCLSLCAALIFSTFVFAQNNFKLDAPKTTQEEGWVGNENVSNFSLFEDAEYVIAPRMFSPDLTGQIDAIKFYRNAYNEYNTTQYTLKIYENVNLQLFDQSLHLYYYESCGDLVYSQDFTAETNGWVTIDLDTPYNIKSGDFWVGIQMHGMGTIVTGDAGYSVEGMYYYTEMNNYVWYWSPTYFWLNYEDVLYSCGFSVHVVEGAPSQCDAPYDLTGAYVWNADDSYGVSLNWSIGSATPSHYNIYRSENGSDFSKIAEVNDNQYFDDLTTAALQTYSYKVTAYYDADACESDASNVVAVEVTSVDEAMESVMVYPNPVQGSLTIQAPEMSLVSLLDKLGRVIQMFDVEGQTMRIDMTQVPAGVYFVRIVGEKGVAVRRVVNLD